MTINDSKTRPMMGVAREGIFSSLQFNIEGSMILDLYAGSGLSLIHISEPTRPY